MLVTRFRGLAAVLALVATMTVGCTTKYQQRIDKLSAEIDDLKVSKGALEGQLSQVAYTEGTLRNELSVKAGELTAALNKIKELQGSVAPSVGGMVVGMGKFLETFTLSGDILFSAGRATLTAPGKRELDKVATRLKASHAGRIVRVYGHTDSDPIRKSRTLWKDNLDLSANRAMAVARYLVDKEVGAGRIETVAMGATRPVASNRTTAGKARNRRVEIVVVKD